MTISRYPGPLRRACAFTAMALALSACDPPQEEGAGENGMNAQAKANDIAPAPAAKEDPAAPRADGRTLYLSPEGLAAGRPGVHASDNYAFGLPRADALAGVTAILGPPSSSDRNETCSSGPMEVVRWGGFAMNFRGGRFVGWSQEGPPSDPPIRTEFEVGVGSRRGEINANDGPEPVVRRTSRGLAFASEGLEGLLSGPGPDARVTLLHAGQNCFARRSGALG
jgi:hypothetical protein